MSVVELQTLLDRSTKNMGSGMNPVVKESALEVIRCAYKKGIYVQLSAGFRSYAEQNALYAKGRTKPGSIVTNARGGYSNHNFGLAVDYFLTDKEGKTAHWDIRKDMNANQVADWIEVANIAKSLGFSWGGDWKSFPDYPHLEMTGGLSTSQLRAGSRPRLVSKVSKTTAPGVSNPAPKPAAKKYPLPDATYWVKKPLFSGAGVRQVQEALASIYFYPEKGAKNNGVDGYYGAKTADAVKRFQSVNGLKADGDYGPATKKVLDKKVNK